jgi:putative Mn2+ efflux pump MntP
LTISIFEIVLIAVALGFDAFAVGLGIGTTCCAPRQVFRLSFHLLLFIGARMVRQGAIPAEEETECPDPTKGFSLVMLSLATSIDALGVGFGLGVLNQNLFFVAVWIGITASAMTWSAMKIGNRLSQRFARRMEIIGGLILIIIAFKLLLA